ncbi:MAG: PocR ligand-binding domain-containing protein [Syntrophobacteraceae bacterium]
MQGPINYRLTDLIDIERTQALLKHFLDAVGVPAAIIDLEGSVLVTSRWQRVCTDFHRTHEVTRGRCIESDTVLANELLHGKTFSLYRCPNGLTDAASPIIIEGKHLANAFIGQFLTEKPDLDFFRRQAEEFGFEPAAYLEALSEIPVVSRDRLPSILAFLTSFAEMIAGMGLKQLRQLEIEKELSKAREELEKQNEALRRYQLIAGNSRDIILFMRRSDGQILEANAAASMAYGYDHEQLLAMTIHELRTPDFVGLTMKQMDQADRRGLLFEAVHKRRDGSTFPVEISSRGATIGDTRTLVSVVRDITERKQMEEELRKSRDELEAHVRERTAELRETLTRLELVNQELQDFAFIASHDLQEPLRKIRAFGDRIRARCADRLDETGKDYLVRMENAANRMQQLIRDLLKYSRVAVRTEPFQRICLKTIADEVLQIFEFQLNEKGGRIEIENLPEIEADSTQMKQLFQNLIGNALKFHRGDQKPVVRVYGVEEKDHCCIQVEDNGIGFEESYLDRIFIPFQRLHARNEEYEGTGMGLAICRKIVERHGGRITATSSPGAGTKFIVTLPLKQKDSGTSA